jgi:hypothetical protein
MGSRANSDVSTRRLDSIRQTLLWKLAPGLRHAIMGQLQALRWSAEATARILQDSGDLTKARENADVVVRESTSAMKSADSIIEWLRPRQDTRVLFNAGIGLCVKLASEDWFLRGIQIKVELADNDFRVSERALQETIVAGLLVLTDLHKQNADFHLTSGLDKNSMLVTMTGSAASRNSEFAAASDDRTLTWSDLELLAQAHDVDCVRDDVRATLRFGPKTLGQRSED